MAEAIADLHGFKDGVIVHGDIQLCQYLINRDGQLKLNDFNRAEVMLWDTKKQDYCRFRSGLVYGNYRSPEEDEDEPLNEQIDVFSLGKHLELLRAVDHDSMYLCFFF
jgi:serine/threonine protein kinase